jgi:type IV pilus assembly protein PilC
MATFHYTGSDALGRPVSGTIRSLSETVARHALAEERQIRVASVRPSFFSREWGPAKPKAASVIFFTRWTASLLKSLTLQESLEITRDDLGDARMERVLWDVSVRVKLGGSLADAMAEHPRAFSSVYVAAVRAAEQANLQDVMRMLATSQKQTQEMRRKVAKGLAYPATILGIGMVVTLVILYVVVPRFARAVAEAGAQAPLIMRMMLGASEVLRLAGPALLATALLLAWLTTRAYRRGGGFRRRTDALLLRIPVLGNLVRQAALSTWARLFAILYSSGTPVASAVTLAAQTIGNAVLRDRLLDVARGHVDGRPLWQEMKRVKMPAVASKMTRVGEEGGRLAEMMHELADHYAEETSYTVEKLASKLEPLAIIIIMIPIALLVGGVYALVTSSIQTVTQ